MSRLAYLTTAAALLLIGACSASGSTNESGPNGAGAQGSGAQGSGGASTIPDGGILTPDTGTDPFDPDAACGVEVTPTIRVPGSLLIAFDRSGSMGDAPSGSTTGTSKWDLARAGIRSVLTALPDDLNVGLLMFPTTEGSECDVILSAGVPHVKIGPLGTTRPTIEQVLTTIGANGGTTPAFDALRASYRYLDTLSAPGQRGVVLVTDGAENCDRDVRDAVMTQVEQERIGNGYLTFAVGLDQSDSDLSTIALNGGTRRTDTCLADCTTDVCMSPADCFNSAPCVQVFPGFPGFCGCNTNADCPVPLNCTPSLFGNTCDGSPDCCHYNAAASSFQSDFEAALNAIAKQFLDSCVFNVPNSGDPNFNPGLVNVGVTFEGQERVVLPQSTDASVDSWQYDSPDNSTLIIQGSICEQLLSSAAEVEIVVGCPTVVH